jgi:hypothetical protein
MRAVDALRTEVVEADFQNLAIDTATEGTGAQLHRRPDGEGAGQQQHDAGEEIEQGLLPGECRR